jgi:hypothetical protein
VVSFSFVIALSRSCFTSSRRLSKYYLNGGDAYRLKLWLTYPREVLEMMEEQRLHEEQQKKLVEEQQQRLEQKQAQLQQVVSNGVGEDATGRKKKGGRKLKNEDGANAS